MNKFIIKSITNTLFIKSVSETETVWTANFAEAAQFDRIGDAMRVAASENEKYGETLFKVIDYTPVSSKL